MLDVCFLFRKHAKVKLKENADRTKMLKETMAQKTVSDRETVIITIIQEMYRVLTLLLKVLNSADKLHAQRNKDVQFVYSVLKTQ